MKTDSDTQPSQDLSDLDPFTRAYIEAIYFTEAGPDSDEIKEHHGLSPAALVQIGIDCAAFQGLASHYIAGGCTRTGSGATPKEQAGHDFWLTRNGHGAGFWDGDWPKETGAAMTKLSEWFGPVQPYLGDDSLIHF